MIRRARLYLDDIDPDGVFGFIDSLSGGGGSMRLEGATSRTDILFQIEAGLAAAERYNVRIVMFDGVSTVTFTATVGSVRTQRQSELSPIVKLDITFTLISNIEYTEASSQGQVTGVTGATGAILPVGTPGFDSPRLHQDNQGDVAVC